MFGFLSKKKEATLDEIIETPPVEEETNGNTMKVPFDYYTGRIVPKRSLSVNEMNLVLDNLDVLWRELTTRHPMLNMHMLMAVEDEFSRHTLTPYLELAFGKEKVEQAPVDCFMSYVKLSIIILSVYTTLDVAYELVKFQRHGVIDGMSNITWGFIRINQNPINFDVQLAVITSVVWCIGHANQPSRTTHSAVEVLSQFELQSDDDLKDILSRLIHANTRAQIKFM